MPPVNGLNILVKTDAINQDIISAIHNSYPEAVKQCKGIAKSFVGANRLQTSFNIWKWLKANIHYVKDVKGSQWVKLPNRFISDGSGDCKSYSLFTGAILGALNIPFSFRYTSYIPGSSIPTHIYVVTQDEKGQPIIIDGVYKAFNSQKAFEFNKDYPMNVSVLSGLEDNLYGISEDDYIGAVLSSCTPHEIRKAHRAITHINKKSGVYGPDDIEDIGSLKTAVKKVTKAVSKAVPLKQVASKVATAVKADTKKIVSAVKKVAEASPKIALAPARGAYLLLLKENVHGFATKVMQKRNDPALKNRWENLGGSFNELIKAAESGAKKKSIFGVGVVGATASLASAAAIIAALAPILGKGETAPGTPAADSSSGSKVATLIKKATPFVKLGTNLLGSKAKVKTVQTLIPSAAGSKKDRLTALVNKGKQTLQAQAASSQAAELKTSSGGSSYGGGSSSGSSYSAASPEATEQLQETEQPGSNNTLLLIGAAAFTLYLISQ